MAPQYNAKDFQTYRQPYNGMKADMRDLETVSATWPMRVQISHILVAAMTAGDHDIRIVGDELDVTTTVTASGDVDTFVSAIDVALGTKPELINKFSGVANLDDDRVEVTFKASGAEYEVTFPVNPGTDLSHTLAQSADPGYLPIGVGVVRTGEGRDIRLPQAGDSGSQIAGIVWQDPAAIDGYTGAKDSKEKISAGKSLRLVTKGPVYLDVEEAVTPDSPVYVRVVAPGTEQVGALRGSETGQSQITEGAVDFNGTDQVGVVFDGDYRVSVASVTDSATTAAALADAVNAQRAAIPGKPTASVPSANTLRLSFSDYKAHTVTEYSPATAGVSSITDTQAAELHAVQIAARFETSGDPDKRPVVFLNLP